MKEHNEDENVEHVVFKFDEDDDDEKIEYKIFEQDGSQYTLKELIKLVAKKEFEDTFNSLIEEFSLGIVKEKLYEFIDEELDNQMKRRSFYWDKWAKELKLRYRESYNTILSVFEKLIAPKKQEIQYLMLEMEKIENIMIKLQKDMEQIEKELNTND